MLLYGLDKGYCEIHNKGHDKKLLFQGTVLLGILLVLQQGLFQFLSTRELRVYSLFRVASHTKTEHQNSEKICLKTYSFCFEILIP